MRFIWILLLGFCLSSCSIIDACFNSHLAKAGRKYDSYGKKSGAKSYSAKRHKRARHAKSKNSMMASAKRASKKSTTAGTSMNRTMSSTATASIANNKRVYTKKELKVIKKENKKMYKRSRKGKGKFRYGYEIPSPYEP